MAIYLYNTLSRTKEEFKPVEPGKVRIYVCGPTVYDFLHIGNFRGPVFFNMLRNWFEKSGYKVEYALNFTDIDDRIINKAIAEKVKADDVSERYIAEYKKDFELLGLKKHEHNPKVTEYLDDIETMVQTLITKKKAYEIDGDVYFQVDQFPGYGKLSGRHLDELQAGTRVDVDERKKAPMDFALWKKAKPNEPFWTSKWGQGRPGWHIECSAMIHGLFDQTIDIHGGGLDLVFPHHENEIAQSEAASGKKFVNYWLHWNMLNIDGQKMSKSIGNIISMREFMKQYPSEVYKWLILSAHYRSTLDFNDETLTRAIANLARIYSSLSLAEEYIDTGGVSGKDLNQARQDLQIEKASISIEAALNDDFNTPEVWAAFYEVLRIYNSKVKRGAKPTGPIVALSRIFFDWTREIGSIMSLFQKPAKQFLIELDDLLLKKKDLARSKVDQLVAARSEARAAKDFAKSDELRKELADLGISVMDLPQGSFWEVTK
jgi:cysteinyl-tRNA synthetase